MNTISLPAADRVWSDRLKAQEASTPPPGAVSSETRGFFEVVARRQSIRRFKPIPVDARTLTRILQATSRAPSAGNLQAYQIRVVRKHSVRARLAEAAGNQSWVAAAPVILVFLADPSRSARLGGRKGDLQMCLQDATIAGAYAQLAATALGLATVWLGASVDAQAVRHALKLTQDLRPMAVMPLGYPDETPRYKSRRPLRELVVEV